MTQEIKQDVRRHPDSCIDFDFNRTRATALRDQAKRDTSTLKAAFAFVLTMLGALAVALLIAAAPIRASSGQAAMAQTNHASVR
jgi:hypothetical protein